MTEKWRLLDTGLNDAFYNMAFDEAIVVARSQDLVPNTIRLFRWKPSAVSIGYFQGLLDEIDINFCGARGIDYVRRRTGGGAVYHDTQGEITYSIIVSQNHRLISNDFQKTYETLCHGLTIGLDIIGIPAKFHPINDILVNDKKISGNAQTRGLGVVHQHGTLLREVDPKLMFTVLKVPNEKIRDKLIKSVSERVTSVNDYLKRDVEFYELKKALLEGFESAFDIELQPSVPLEFEKKTTDKLISEKYRTRAWNFRR